MKTDIDVPYAIEAVFKRHRKSQMLLVFETMSVEIAEPAKEQVARPFTVEKKTNEKRPMGREKYELSSTLTYRDRNWMAINPRYVDLLNKLPEDQVVPIKEVIEAVLFDHYSYYKKDREVDVSDSIRVKLKSERTAVFEKLAKDLDNLMVHDGKVYVAGVEPVYLIKPGDPRYTLPPRFEIIASVDAGRTDYGRIFNASEWQQADEYARNLGIAEALPVIDKTGTGLAQFDARQRSLRTRVLDLLAMLEVPLPKGRNSEPVDSVFLMRIGGPGLCELAGEVRILALETATDRGGELAELAGELTRQLRQKLHLGATDKLTWQIAAVDDGVGAISAKMTSRLAV